MHGRLKVKTTAEQEAEKQKERKIKQAKYTKGMSAVFQKREQKEYDDESLYITSQLLFANPEGLSLWNFRRTILLHMKKTIDASAYVEYLNGELQVTENCLMKNPKSYAAWHHRGWALGQSEKPPYDNELQLCNLYLQKDERNFHCWDHRRLVVEKSSRSLEKELSYTQELLDKNFSNYSAWHYRSKLLPILFPPKSNDCPHPVDENTFLKELDQVVASVFTDPSDQSPWFFLRWLLNHKQQNPRLIQVATVPRREEDLHDLVLIFSQRVPDCSDLNISIANSLVSIQSLEPCDENQTIWKMPLKDRVECVSLEISHKVWFSNESVNVECACEPRFYWLHKELPSQRSLSQPVINTLKEVMSNCVTLNDLDQGNKWVLLTLVDLMSALDVRLHKNSILDYLSQLENIDPLRTYFYKDFRSKIVAETHLMDFLEDETLHEFELHESLSLLIHPQYLCSFTKIDLSLNFFRNANFAECFLNCRDLNLDKSEIKSLKLPLLIENVSLVDCRLCSISQLGNLTNCSKVKNIKLDGNNIQVDQLGLS